MAKQVADLERELEEQDGMRSTLQEVFEAGTAGLVRQSGEASHMEGLEESAAREERRRQEQVLGTSSSWDLAVRRLEKSVEGVSRTFKEGNGMLAVAPLTALKAAEENLDSELKALMVKQFGSEDNGEKRENSIGRNQDYSSLSRELARLRASLFQAEWQRIMLEAKQRGHSSLNKSDTHTLDDDGGEVEKLEREVKIALGDLVDALCQRVIGEDYREKAERGEEVKVELFHHHTNTIFSCRLLLGWRGLRRSWYNRLPGESC